MSAPSGARARTSPPLRRRRIRVDAWAVRHLQTFFYSLGQLAHTPLSTLMTAAVVGISLSLPAGLYVLIGNVQRVSQGWGGTVQVSLFLKPAVSDAAARALAGRLQARPGVARVRVITHAEALAEYRRLSGFGNVLDLFKDENPLPAVLVVQPDRMHSTPDTVAALVAQLRRLPEVDLARFDLAWLQRLYAILGIARRGVAILAALLALGVVLVVGNTIRLGIEGRRAEIEIAKLFGATDAFIRRPFLYNGLWYGALGGLIAWVLVTASLALLHDPVARLTALYSSRFELSGLGGEGSLELLLTGVLLGLGGSWLAVGRHLHAIEPS